MTAPDRNHVASRIVSGINNACQVLCKQPRLASDHIADVLKAARLDRKFNPTSDNLEVWPLDDQECASQHRMRHIAILPAMSGDIRVSPFRLQAESRVNFGAKVSPHRDLARLARAPRFQFASPRVQCRSGSHHLCRVHPQSRSGGQFLVSSGRLLSAPDCDNLTHFIRPFILNSESITRSGRAVILQNREIFQ